MKWFITKNHLYFAQIDNTRIAENSHKAEKGIISKKILSFLIIHIAFIFRTKRGDRI